MGVVYADRHVGGLPVAVKVTAGARAQDPRWQALFTQDLAGAEDALACSEDVIARTGEVDPEQLALLDEVAALAPSLAERAIALRQDVAARTTR